MIFVIGDVMLDKFIYGDVERISPEAPVPIVKVNKEKYFLGGAANVARNIASLNQKPTLIGLLGNDENSKVFLKLCEKYQLNTALLKKLENTITKIRIIGQNQQMIRLDYEKIQKTSNKTIDELISRFEVNKKDIIVISDYAKGLITEYLMKKLMQTPARIIVDPKPKNIELYKGTYLIKMNKKEAEAVLAKKTYQKLETEKDYINAIRSISKEYNSNIIITLGHLGSILYNKNTKQIKRIKGKDIQVYDVTGAGDTFIATLAVFMQQNNIEKAMEYANKASELVVQKKGTSTVEYKELIQ